MQGEGARVGTEATLLDALRSVPGVAAADIEPDERTDGAGTLRLQLSPGADEIAVATSVNRVLREQFGLAVDANRVQVVEESLPSATSTARNASEQTAEFDIESGQRLTPEIEPYPELEPEPQRPTLTAVPGYRDGGDTDNEAEASNVQSSADTSPPPQVTPARGSRILIQKMQLVSAGLGVTTSVSLSWLSQTYTGEASAAATPTSVHRSVAMATLSAVEGVVGGRARFELEQLEVNQLGPDRAVVVVVSMLTRVGSERLTGVSVIREDVRQAVIRATLDSLNRRIESLLLTA